MKRLTQIMSLRMNGDHSYVIKGGLAKNRDKVVNRLAKYEDTELMPEEIESLQKRLDSLEQERNYWRSLAQRWAILNLTKGEE